MAKRGTLEHPKTRRLGRALNLPAWAALGLLEALWHWVSRYCPEGLLTDEDIEDCADTIRFDGGGAGLAEVLESCGLLDRQDGGWYVHDWHDHADETTKKALEKAGKRFANGSQSRRFTKKTEPPKQCEQFDSEAESECEQFANDSQPPHEPNATAKPSLAKPNQALLTPPTPPDGGEVKPALVEEPPPPDEPPKRQRRTWADVCREMSEAMPKHAETLAIWFKFRASKPGGVWVPATVAENVAEFASWPVERLKAAVRHSIRNSYQAIYEPKGSHIGADSAQRESMQDRVVRRAAEMDAILGRTGGEAHV